MLPHACAALGLGANQWPGSGKTCGRLNRAGIEALYLALESETAIAEFQQAAALLPPATLATYRVTLDKVVDFRGGYQTLIASVLHKFVSGRFLESPSSLALSASETMQKRRNS